MLYELGIIFFNEYTMTLFKGAGILNKALREFG